MIPLKDFDDAIDRLMNQSVNGDDSIDPRVARGHWQEWDQGIEGEDDIELREIELRVYEPEKARWEPVALMELRTIGRATFAEVELMREAIFGAIILEAAIVYVCGCVVERRWLIGLLQDLEKMEKQETSRAGEVCDGLGLV